MEAWDVDQRTARRSCVSARPDGRDVQRIKLLVAPYQTASRNNRHLYDMHPVIEEAASIARTAAESALSKARMQIVIEQTGEGLTSFCAGIGALRQLHGIGTSQFVKGVPPGPVFGDQGDVGQLGYQPARRFGWDAEQAGTGRGRDISGRLQ